MVQEGLPQPPTSSRQFQETWLPDGALVILAKKLNSFLSDSEALPSPNSSIQAVTGQHRIAGHGDPSPWCYDITAEQTSSRLTTGNLPKSANCRQAWALDFHPGSAQQRVLPHLPEGRAEAWSFALSITGPASESHRRKSWAKPVGRAGAPANPQQISSS